MSRIILQSDSEQIFNDASDLLKSFPPPKIVEIPEEMWPDSIKKLRPDAVRTFHGGLLLRTHIDKRYERGIFIDVESPESEPGSGSGETHTIIVKGFYSTEIKIRPRMKLKKPQVKTKPNQNIDPTRKTPVESGKD
jgi:hypothetical protein